MVRETPLKPISGWAALIVAVALVAGLITLALSVDAGAKGLVVAATVVVAALALRGFIAVQPNDSRALLLFGRYVGTAKESGFFWVNPFYARKAVSLRIRNFETGSITTQRRIDWASGKTTPKSRTPGKASKVNDRDGNPIEISAVVVWRVVDTAEALFEVDDYEDFVAVQSEAALRNLASRHPYDSEDHQISLRGSTDVICANLRDDIQERLGTAGVEVVEARISHLAYAPEIAAAMLRRQQAQAVVAARTKIVEGAVGMVESALEHIAKRGIVDLDDERRAAMVSNLLVVLCSDRDTQPVVNAGSLYQ